jgi:ribosomal protein L6P/L9E
MKEKIKAVQGLLALIKQLLIETSAYYKKLQFVGVGYRAFQVDNFENKLLLFKLGTVTHFILKYLMSYGFLFETY